MKRLRLQTLFFLLGLSLAAAPALAETALVWATGNAGAGTQGVAAYIMSHGCFTAVDATDADFVDLSTLMNYDAVLYFSNESLTQDPIAIGNVLADYADTGRRLVVATFSWAEQGSNTLGGRFITDGISPFLAEGGTIYQNVTMASNDGSGYFTGVNTVNGYFHDNVMLSSGAVERGTWSDGEPLLADKANVVAVDLFPDDSWGSIGGDYQQLFANAMCWNSGPVPVQVTTWGMVKSLYR
jgi:hypothetical protein